MLPSPVPADPGWGEDLAWLDRDPVTAAEFEASLDRLCARDEGPGQDEDDENFEPFTPEELAGIQEAAADELLAAKAASTGRRGPGQPGSARTFPGGSSSRAAAFGPGMVLDVLPGCAGLAAAADAAGFAGFAGVSEAELVGVMCGWDRVEAHAHARKLAVIAELARRNPGELDAEFTRDQERWLQDTGNAALMGCELPPAEALAADEQITARAKDLRAAGVEGDMDQLRARAFLDLLLGQDSRPGQGRPGTPGVAPAGFAARITLTAPLATLAGLADRPGELGSLGPVDPWLARDLARAAAANPKTTWCLTVTDSQGHAVAHGCARPEPKSRRTRAGPGPPPGEQGFTFTPADRDRPPGGYETWRLTTPGTGPDLIITIDPITTDPCDHRHQAKGHDPGVKLRHLSQIRHATCTSPVCRRPAAQCDHEHNTPYEAGGRTCLCNTGPKCRHDHRLKQHPKWTVDQLPDGTFRWTTPAGRSYDTEPTRYPI